MKPSKPHHIIAILPARMGSSRFPGKPLAPILGRPMIEHVYRRTAMSPVLSAVYVATCDQEISEAVEGFGGRVVMTADSHIRASDRVAEAAENIEADIVVMVQGDEPMLVPDQIAQSVEPMLNDPEVVCANLAGRIETEAEFEDRNCIKVVMDKQMNALYFSREPIPTRRIQPWGAVPAFKQVCVIPFRRDFLLTYAALEPTPLEVAESVDMMRVIEHGYRVKLAETEFETHAVDTPEDLSRVEALMADDPLTEKSLGSVPV